MSNSITSTAVSGQSVLASGADRASREQIGVAVNSLHAPAKRVAGILQVTVSISGADILSAYGKDRPATGFHESGWIPFIPGKMSREDYNANADAFVTAAAQHGLVVHRRDSLQAGGQLQVQVPATELGGRQFARALQQFKNTRAGGGLMTVDDSGLLKLLKDSGLGKSASFMKGFKAETQKLWDEGGFVRGMNLVQAVVDVAGTRAGVGGSKGYRPLPAAVQGRTRTTGNYGFNGAPAGTSALASRSIAARTQARGQALANLETRTQAYKAAPGAVTGKALHEARIVANALFSKEAPDRAQITPAEKQRFRTLTNQVEYVTGGVTNAANDRAAKSTAAAPGKNVENKPGSASAAGKLTPQDKRRLQDAVAMRSNPVQPGDDVGSAKRRGVDFKSAIAGSTAHRVAPGPFDPAATNPESSNNTPATSKKADPKPGSAGAVGESVKAMTAPVAAAWKALNKTMGNDNAIALVECYVAARKAGIAPFRAVVQMHQHAAKRLGFKPTPEQLAQVTQVGDAMLSARATTTFSTMQGSLSREQLAQLTTRVDNKARAHGRGGSLTTRATLESKIANNLQDQLFSVRDGKTGQVVAAAAVGSDVIRNHQGRLFDGVKVDYLSDGSDPAAIQKLTLAAYRYAQNEGAPLIIYPASEALANKVYIPKLRNLMESGELENVELLSEKNRDGETFFVMRRLP